MSKFNEFKIGRGISFFSIYKPSLKFNTFEFYFFIKRTPKNMMLANMISRLLDYDPSGYDNEISSILREMYNAKMEFSCEVCQDKIYIKASISVLMNKYAFETSEDLCKKALNMLFDIILSADIDSRDVYYDILMNIKCELNRDTKIKDDFLGRAFENIFPDSVASINHISSLSSLDDISYNVYADFYRELLNTSEILIFGYGDYDEVSVCSYMKERFEVLKDRKIIKWDKDYGINFSKASSVIKTNTNNDYCNITVFYHLDTSVSFKKYVALSYLYAIMQEGIMMEYVREKNGLVYNIDATSFIRYGVVAIYANLSNDNFDKVMSYVTSKKLISLDKFDDETLSQKLTNSKKKMNNIIKFCDEGASINYIVYAHYNHLKDIDFDSISLKDIREFAKAISRGTSRPIYYYEKSDEGSEA